MTTINEIPIKCPVCKEKFNMTVIMSTNTMDYADLDLRPAEMQRSTMYISINECPNCGYAEFDFSREPKIKREYLESEEYQSCEGIEFKSERSKPFYKAYLINRKEENIQNELNFLMHSIWSCDDSEDCENARKLRRIACQLLETILSNIEKHKEWADKDTLMLIKSDLMRRGEMFDELIEEYGTVSFEDTLLNNINQFQIKKAKEKDSARYTIGTVISLYG